MSSMITRQVIASDHGAVMVVGLGTAGRGSDTRAHAEFSTRTR